MDDEDVLHNEVDVVCFLITLIPVLLSTLNKKYFGDWKNVLVLTFMMILSTVNIFV